MSGASHYAHEHGLFQKKVNKALRPYLKKTKLKWIHLIIDGIIEYGPHYEDKYVAIVQYLMQKGYDRPFITDGQVSRLQQFFQEALFTINPFHFEQCRINGGFSLVEFRKQFDFDNEIELQLAPFYRNRAYMPLEFGESVLTLKYLIFQGRGKYNHVVDELKYSFNEYHPTAKFIMNRQLVVEKHQFIYRITYSFEQDCLNYKSGKGPYSSWDINIYSTGENYIDFLIKLYRNYDRIIAGDKDLLKHKFEWKGNTYILNI